MRYVDVMKLCIACLRALVHEGVFKTNKDCEQVIGCFILSPLSLRLSLFLHIQPDAINV